jgi:uncharacterized protein
LNEARNSITATITVVIGASVRAAAQSLERAGYRPWCVDLFADRDLRAIVPDAVRIPFANYPYDFRRILAEAPDAPWVYTGGLENHPGLIDDLARIRPLLGATGDALRAIRDPLLWTTKFNQHGFATPCVDYSGYRQTRWMRKPLDSSGGKGVEVISAYLEPIETPGFYFQEFIEGRSCSAVYRDGEFLGATEMLVGRSECNASGFTYCGNIGPIDLTIDQERTLRRMGRFAFEEFHIPGPFGIDYIDASGIPIPIEINPRYTASMEIIEATTGNLVFSTATNAPRATMAGKAILYATRDSVFEATTLPRIEGITYADIPMHGEPLAKGWPVCTLIAHESDPNSVRTRLFEALVKIDV